jgi:arylsulfatase A
MSDFRLPRLVAEQDRIEGYNTKGSTVMKNQVAMLVIGLVLASATSHIACAADTTTTKSNIVFILVDDLGWADVGCFGSKYYETPHIDRLASEGMRFTDAYAACAVCSPTRASIMTGKYPARLHLTDYIPGEGDSPRNLLKVPEWQKYLPLDEVTIAAALKSAGYVSASIGKWHLGGPPYYPQHHGFDVNVAGGDIGHPATYFWPYQGKSSSVPGLQGSGEPGEYLTDRLTDEAEKFIERNKEGPFFLYFAHYAVHQPLMAKADIIAKYKQKPPHGGQKKPVYAAMIESVDQSVGRILAKLDALGIAERTAVIFMSDNGGLTIDGTTSNAPLRAGKGFPYEGGVREPLIIKWPGTTKPGTTCGVPVCSIDFLPTILEMAGVQGDPRRQAGIDGLSLVPLLKQSCTLARDALYWHYPHYWQVVRPFGAVRTGDWKLIEFYEDMRVELYNLKDDIGEAEDLAGRMPEKVAELRNRLHAWRESVGAQMPTPNPDAASTSSAATMKQSGAELVSMQPQEDPMD